MGTRNIIALILIIISLLCLYPGLTYPILSIKVGTTLPIVGEMVLHESTQSIISTIKTLFEQNNTLVAFLILLFSVVVPILKALILIAVLFVKGLGRKKSWFNFVAAIGKWSMADVFVVGVFLAYLATKSDAGITAKIHEGFYFFTAYCIISLIAIQIMKVEDDNE